MKYYLNKTVSATFEDTLQKVTEALKKEGFGILTEIDIKATLKKKLDVDFRKYQILGACNPPFAHQALLIEERIGVMLPCNVVVQELDNGKVEVFAIDPLVSMQAVENDALMTIAKQVKERLQKVVESL